jgi:DNA-binding transcriptional ArsR family regulator
MPSTWSTIEQPILEAIGRLAANPPDNAAIIETTGLAQSAVEIALKRLYESEYITGLDVSTMGSGFEMMRIELLERGLRATGVWPADAYDEFVAAVQDAIARESDPAEKTKLEKLRDAAAGISREVATTLIVDAFKRAAGL